MRRIIRLAALFIALTLLFSCESGRKANGTADSFTIGYGECDISFDLAKETIYVAGYRGNNPAEGVLDVPKVRAVWLGADVSVLLLSVDCIALASGTVASIRAELTGLSAESGCREIHIISTHDHAGGDTLGPWGPDGIDGKNAEYMRSLTKAAVTAAEGAYLDRRAGKLYFGSADCSDLLEDTRLPRVFDGNVYSFRFMPDDGSDGIRILNLASHAEALGGGNTMISADFPAYIAKRIKELSGERTIYFPGAIGGLIRTAFTDEDGVLNCRLTGERIADRALAISGETELPPEISCIGESFEISCENPLFIGMRFLGVLGNDIRVSFGRVTVKTEMTLLTLGGKRILLLPGEIFPELVYGGDADFVPTHPEREDPPTLCGIFGDDLLIFGLADDEIGYIIPPSDLELHPAHPYLTTPEKDHNGENHYEETNSVGMNAAAEIAEAAERIYAKLRMK